MAIAFDTVTTGSGSGTSLTFASGSISGSNRLLLVPCWTTVNTGDHVTGVTYNGVAMARIQTVSYSPGAVRLYLYALAAPATGANNVVISADTTTGIDASAISYTGCKQTGIPDASTTLTTASGTTHTITLTPVATGCWMIMMGWGDNHAMTAGTNCNAQRGSFIFVSDTNGATVTAGSPFSMTGNTSGTDDTGQIAMTFAPFVQSGPANLKTWNGLAEATIKNLFPALAIGSVKTWNGLT